MSVVVGGSVLGIVNALTPPSVVDLTPLEEDLSTLGGVVSGIQETVGELGGDLSSLGGTVSGIQETLGGLSYVAKIAVTALPTSNIQSDALYVLSQADDVAKAPPGSYMYIGGWVCIECTASYALTAITTTITLTLIPGVIYTWTQGQELTTFTITPGARGITTIIKTGEYAVALPTSGSATVAELYTDAWDDAANANAKLVLDYNGSEVLVSATTKA